MIYVLGVFLATGLYALLRITHPVAVRVKRARQWKRLRRDVRRGRARLRVVPAWDRRSK